MYVCIHILVNMLVFHRGIVEMAIASSPLIHEVICMHTHIKKNVITAQGHGRDGLRFVATEAQVHTHTHIYKHTCHFTGARSRWPSLCRHSRSSTRTHTHTHIHTHTQTHMSLHRGTVEMAFALSPLTYQVDPAIMLNMLPHNIFFWVMAFLKPTDLRPCQVCMCT